MEAPLFGGRNFTLLEYFVHVISVELLATLQSLDKEFSAFCKCRFVQSGLSIKYCRTRNDARGKERQHPANIFRCNEWKRAAHGPGADDGSCSDSLFYGSFCTL